MMDANTWRHPTSSWRVRRLLDPVFRGTRLGFRGERIAAKEYLDIGCGTKTSDAFISLDYLWHGELDICCDVTKGIPLPDRRVKGVFSEHCIEHLELADATRLFAEILRVLRPGGTFRIVVPDAEIYARGYLALRDGTSTEALPYREFDGIDGVYTPVMSLNRIFNQWGHRFIYDADTLCALLTAAGFVNARRVSFREGRDPVLVAQDSEEHVRESLYVEAERAAG